MLNNYLFDVILNIFDGFIFGNVEANYSFMPTVPATQYIIYMCIVLPYNE